MSKKWDARFGGVNNDYLSTICHANDGGYIIAGTSNSGISGNKTQPNWDTTLTTQDYWIVKIDVNGSYQWDKRYGGTSGDGIFSISTTRDGGYIIGGESESDSSGDKTQNTRGGLDYWVVKIDSLGNKQWDRTFGGSNDDFLQKVTPTKDGGYILGGSSQSGISGDKTQPNWDPSEVTGDYWIVKIDSTGNKEWDKRFGGTSGDGGGDVIQTLDGGYLIGGTSGSGISGDKTQANFGSQVNNFWIVKTDSLGNKLWDRVYGGELGEVFGNSLNTKDGNYMLGGTSYDGYSGNKTSDSCGYWLIKIDKTGNKLGDWAYGNCGTMHSMSNISDGGYLLAGAVGNIYTIKVDSLMNIVWGRTSYLGPGSIFSVGALESSTGCYVVGVSTNVDIGGDKTQASWGGYDYWIVEYCDSFPLGIQETQGDMHLLVYPNPTKGDLYINMQKDNLTEASFTLTNTTGQIIYQNTSDHLAHSYTKIIELSGLPIGVYMLAVTVDGERIVKKVLKQ